MTFQELKIKTRWLLDRIKKRILNPVCPHCGARMVPVKKMFHTICSKCRRIIR